MSENLKLQLDKNLKLIERIKKYAKFFEKLEKDPRYKKGLMKGQDNFFDENGQLNITEEDIKMGRKLDFIENMDFTNKADQKLEAKLNYYKNLKPKGGVFKVANMDATEEIQQMAHERNKKFFYEQRRRRLARKKNRKGQVLDFGDDEFPVDLDIQAYRDTRNQLKT